VSNYTRQYTSGVSWENLSSTATPLSAANLNQMDTAILRIDSEAHAAINSKANQTTVNGCINEISFEKTTGVFTISFVDGTSTTINTALEKVVTNFTYDATLQSLVLVYEDGSTENISLADFITQYEFEDSDTIAYSVTGGKVRSAIKNGSITGEKLNPNYLTQIQSQVTSAKDYARQSRSYATGDAVDDQGDPYRRGQGTDNSKYYYQLAHEAASSSGAAPFIGATSQAGGTQGLVPGPLIADKDKFLKGDGGWGTPTDTTYSPFTGATSQAAGTEGLVPQPTAGDQDKVLTGGGIWKSDTANLITTYTTEDDANTTAIITGAGGETAMSTMESGAKHSRLFNKVSRIALNTRKLINTVKRVWSTVATSWASGEAYAVGDVRLWTNGHTYVCKLAHTSSSSITPANTTYWDDKSLGDLISSCNSNLTNKIITVTKHANANLTLDSYRARQNGKIVDVAISFTTLGAIHNGQVLFGSLPTIGDYSKMIPIYDNNASAFITSPCVYIYGPAIQARGNLESGKNYRINVSYVAE
jgi:hypothetical protein